MGGRVESKIPLALGPHSKSIRGSNTVQRKFKCCNCNLTKDQNGKITKCFIHLEQEIFQLVNIYAPTKLSSKNELSLGTFKRCLAVPLTMTLSFYCTVLLGI